MGETKRPVIILGVTGSIAAYKAADLTRQMIKSDWDVHVVMTEAATRFITPLTLRTLSRNPVTVDAFADPEMWVPGHISLAERATLLIVAPCTANVIAKLTCGLADDSLTATALACRAPMLIAPAMNTGMWEHPATQRNIKTLADRGVHFVQPGCGDLACGTYGQGRMADPEEIVLTAKKILLK